MRRSSGRRDGEMWRPRDRRQGPPHIQRTPARHRAPGQVACMEKPTSRRTRYRFAGCSLRDNGGRVPRPWPAFKRRISLSRVHGLARSPARAGAREESRRPQARPPLARSGNHGSGAVYRRGLRVPRPRTGRRGRAPPAHDADGPTPPARWRAPGAGPSGNADSMDPRRGRPRTSDNDRASRSSPACGRRKQPFLLGGGHTDSRASRALYSR